MTTLVLSASYSSDNQALWRAALQRGWSVERAIGLKAPVVNDEVVVIYADSLFAPIYARTFGRELLDLSDDWLVRVPFDLRKRAVICTTLGEARLLRETRFIKPPNDKTFEARIYSNGAELPVEFSDDAIVLVSEPVKWASEYRSFCLDGDVVAISPYLRSGVHAKETDYLATDSELNDALTFTKSVLLATKEFTPRAVVLDVGVVVDRGWAVVEANGAWGAGIYGCDPHRVLDVLLHATVRRS